MQSAKTAYRFGLTIVRIVPAAWRVAAAAHSGIRDGQGCSYRHVLGACGRRRDRLKSLRLTKRLLQSDGRRGGAPLFRRRWLAVAPRSNDVSSEQTPNTASEQELARTKARANLLMALYAHVAHDLERSTQERDSLRGELEQARGDLASARSELQRLNSELGQSEARATDLQQRHAALLDSTSWRVTAPLRALGRLVKRRP